MPKPRKKPRQTPEQRTQANRLKAVRRMRKERGFPAKRKDD